VLVYRRVHEGGVTGTQHADLERSGLETAQEYLELLTGLHWPIPLLDLLRRVGHGEPAPWREGLDALRAWAELWKRDKSLAPAERWYLERWTTFMRARHAKSATSSSATVR